MDINQDSKAKLKSSMKMNLGLEGSRLGSTKLKSNGPHQLEVLEGRELCDAPDSLLTEVDQKERIARLTVSFVPQYKLTSGMLPNL